MCAVSNKTAPRVRARSDLWNHPAGDRMRHHPGRAMYEELGAALTSITMQLRSAIQADSWRLNGSGDRLHGDRAWTRQITAELGSVLLDLADAAGAREVRTPVTISLPIPSASASQLP